METRRGAATWLTLSVATVDRLIKSGELPALKLGKSVRIERAAIEAFIRERATNRP